MGIVIDEVRIHGLRGLMDFSVKLDNTNVLIGMNNTGKTSFLKGLQIALGNTHFITNDDFNISNGKTIASITVDVKISPVTSAGKACSEFDDDWEVLFKEDRIMIDDESNSSVPFRTNVTYDPLTASFKTRQFTLPQWPAIIDATGLHWYKSSVGSEKKYRFEEIPFFYIDAQRDILEDMRTRSSYLGRMISKIEYSPADIKAIEKQIKELNDRAVSSSNILANIRDTLKELDTAMDSSSEKVEITPFAKKVRDLNKNITIAYGESKDSFTMEYHGMGTRSWSSLLTLKSFIKFRHDIALVDKSPFFPIVAIEEPEAHLHINAQKKLYNQIDSVIGQKIISTHSPYIASCAHLDNLRAFYKNDMVVKCGVIDTAQMSAEDVRKVERQVTNSRGEIFFSKAVILSEGETEEQALPILAEKALGKCPYEIGIDFVGVGGYGGYLPFLRVLNGFNIPWFIFSDGEKETQKQLLKDLKKIFGSDSELDKFDNVIILENESNFEKHLIEQGFTDEITAAFSEIYNDGYIEKIRHKKNGTQAKQSKTEKTCSKCMQFIYTGEILDYNGDAGLKKCLYDCMIKNKTRLGPVVAELIVKSGKPLPAAVISLLEKIKKV